MNIRPADSLEEAIITVVIGVLIYYIFIQDNNLLSKVLDWVIK